MNKIVIGRKKAPQPEENTAKNKSADFLFAVGITAMCVSLILPMQGEKNDTSGGTAVQVMSTSVAAREELVMPEKDVSTNPGDESIFDYIGEFFAEMIRGE